ncbi:MAG TPA: M56 family metallopeptidase [Candidatus Brocadiales bacterium]|nr:M56 family metallopeptidase [Candidatus Brocadiales bacterium]
MQFLNRRKIKGCDSGIWHVFTMLMPALVTVCLLVICFFPHLIISRFDNIPCSTPRHPTTFSLFHLDNLALVNSTTVVQQIAHPFSLLHLDNLALLVATILIAGTAVFRVRRLLNRLRRIKNVSLFNPVSDKKLRVKITHAIAAIEQLTNYKLPEVKIFNSSASGGLMCFTKGWLRPKIWISGSLVSEMNEDDLQVILAHEFCHVLRYDNLVSRVLTFISDLSWAYPWCRTILKDWYKRRELFCDNFSAQVVASRQKVASTLIKLTEVIMLRKEFHTIIPGTSFYYEEKPLIQTRVENLLCKRRQIAQVGAYCRAKGRFAVANNTPLRTYRYKLWFFALFGLCMFIFVVMVSITLASSLTHIHCLMEDLFSFYCSAC